MKMTLASGFRAPDLTTETLGIIGKRGSGKSHTGTLVVEELLELESQVIVIDPTGGWWGLRAGANGKSSGGFPIPIFGGLHADIPLQDSAGALVAEYVVENRLSAVLDLSGFSKTSMRRFVRDFAERLYLLKNKQRDPVHVVIDECDLFVPQRVDSQDMMPLVGAINDFVLRGRQRGIGVTLISQRPARINKDVLTQVEILIAFRMTGPQDIDAFGDWIEHNGTKEEQKKVLGTLSSLERGTGWFWAPGLMGGLLKKVSFRARHTYDSSRTPDGKKAKPPRTLRNVNLDELSEAMKATVEQAKANDPRALKGEIMRLKKELEKAQKTPPKIQAEPRLPKRVEVPVMTKRQEKKIDALVAALASTRETYEATIAVMKREHERVVQKADEAIEANQGLRTKLRGLLSVDPVRPVKAPTPPLSPKAKVVVTGQTKVSKDDGGHKWDKLESGEVKLGKGERACMIAIAQHGDEGVTKRQLTQITGYARSSRDAYIYRLRKAGHVAERGDHVVRTDEGVAWLGTDYEELPTGDELYKYWLKRLPEGERRVLELAHEEYPEALDKEEISTTLNYARSSRDAYILRLKNRRLIEEPSRGSIIASEALFGEKE